MTGKRLVKRALQQLLAAARAERWHPPPALVVLMYHRVLPRDHTQEVPVQPGMFVFEDTFERHLQILRTHFTPMPLGEWVGRAQNGRALPRRACAVTFDDGWVDNYRHAFPLLRRYGIPATVFLVSDYVGTDRLFWPERLARVLQGVDGTADDEWLRGLLAGAGDDPVAACDRAIARAKALPEQEIHLRLDALGRDAPAPRQMLNWDEVREMAASGVIDFGSHTCNHIRLRDGVPEAVIADEVERSRRAIEDRIGGPVALFCYPNGDLSPVAQRHVRANYRAACTTRKGWNGLRTGDHLNRISVHEGVAYDDTAFTARLSGWI